MRDNKKVELIKNTIIIMIGKISTQLISFIMLPLYTHYLITEEYGLVDLVTTYVTLLTPIITVQLELAIFRYLVENRKNELETKKILTTSLIFIFIVSTTLLILYITIASFFEIRFKILIGILIYISIYSSVLLQVARGMGDNLKYSIACCISGILSVVFNVIFIVYFNMGAKGMLLGLIISNLFASVYIFKALKIHKYISPKFFNKKYLKQMVNYSLPLVPNGLSWWIVNASDRTIISLFLGITLNGIYAVSNKFSSAFVGLFNIFLISWTESASLHINDDDKEDFFSNVFNYIIKLSLSLCILITAIMPFAFEIFIGENYAESYYNIPILFIAMIFNIIGGLYSAIYVAKKDTKNIMYTSILAAIINIAVNLSLIKFIGLYAASISTIIAYLIMAIYRGINTRKYVKIEFDKKVIIISIVMMTINLIIYYLENTYLEIFNIIIMSIYVLLLNYKDLLKILKRKK